MAKKRKNQFPKRFLGVRMPKGMRRFAATPLGTAILADVIVAGAATVARRPAFSGMLGRMGDEARLAGQSGLGFIAHLARAAAVPVTTTAASFGARGESSSRMKNEAASEAIEHEPSWGTPTEERVAKDAQENGDGQPRY